jgi:hypothetical protein
MTSPFLSVPDKTLELRIFAASYFYFISSLSTCGQRIIITGGDRDQRGKGGVSPQLLRIAGGHDERPLYQLSDRGIQQTVFNPISFFEKHPGVMRTDLSRCFC